MIEYHRLYATLFDDSYYVWLWITDI